MHKIYLGHQRKKKEHLVTLVYCTVAIPWFGFARKVQHWEMPRAPTARQERAWWQLFSSAVFFRGISSNIESMTAFYRWLCQALQAVHHVVLTYSELLKSYYVWSLYKVNMYVLKVLDISVYTEYCTVITVCVQYSIHYPYSIWKLLSHLRLFPTYRYPNDFFLVCFTFRLARELKKPKYRTIKRKRERNN